MGKVYSKRFKKQRGSCTSLSFRHIHSTGIGLYYVPDAYVTFPLKKGGSWLRPVPHSSLH